jgi:hypothetical protein
MITSSNFNENSYAVFKGCKKPKRTPDIIIYKKERLYVDFLNLTKEQMKEILKDKGIKYTAIEFFAEETRHRDAFICYRGTIISSQYWYGYDKNGEYVIRCSDHWSACNDKVETNRCENIASCWWNLNNKSTKFNNSGKCYFSKMKKYK